jgi:hypothetical protein
MKAFSQRGAIAPLYQHSAIVTSHAIFKAILIETMYVSSVCAGQKINL